MGGPIIQEVIFVALSVTLSLMFIAGFMVDLGEAFTSVLLPSVMIASITGTLLIYWIWPDINPWTAGILVFCVLGYLLSIALRMFYFYVLQQNSQADEP